MKISAFYMVFPPLEIVKQKVFSGYSLQNKSQVGSLEGGIVKVKDECELDFSASGEVRI